MILTLNRLFRDNKVTIGKLLIDGVPECWTLEDTYHEEKITAETRIPSGSYQIRVRTFGKIHDKYKQRFPEFHAGTLELLNVHNFKNILIHIGNNDKDTEGCILLGKFLNVDNTLSYSTLAYTDFYKKVISSAKHNLLAIIIRDNDLK